MKLNPLAVIFWGIMFCAGYLLGGIHEAVVCLLIALCSSFLFAIFPPILVFILLLIAGVVALVLGLLSAGLTAVLVTMLIILGAWAFLKLLG